MNILVIQSRLSLLVLIDLHLSFRMVVALMVVVDVRPRRLYSCIFSSQGGRIKGRGRPTCHHCREQRHVQRNCLKLQDSTTQYANAVAYQETVESIARIITYFELKSIIISDEEYVSFCSTSYLSRDFLPLLLLFKQEITYLSSISRN